MEMSDLIDKLFPASQIESIHSLWDDEDCHRLIQEQLRKKLSESADIIVEQSWEQFLPNVRGESP